MLNSGYQLLNYIIAERLKRIVEQAKVFKKGRVGAGRVEVSKSSCQKCILSRMKHTDKENESIKSTSTRDEHVSYTGR